MGPGACPKSPCCAEVPKTAQDLCLARREQRQSLHPAARLRSVTARCVLSHCASALLQCLSSTRRGRQSAAVFFWLLILGVSSLKPYTEHLALPSPECCHFIIQNQGMSLAICMAVAPARSTHPSAPPQVPPYHPRSYLGWLERLRCLSSCSDQHLLCYSEVLLRARIVLSFRKHKETEDLCMPGSCPKVLSLQRVEGRQKTRKKVQYLSKRSSQ